MAKYEVNWKDIYGKQHSSVIEHRKVKEGYHSYDDELEVEMQILKKMQKKYKTFEMMQDLQAVGGYDN